MVDFVLKTASQCCTQETIADWFIGFDQYVQIYSLKDQPTVIWNTDETGFSLCPKTVKVVALQNSCNVYGITGNTKEQSQQCVLQMLLVILYHLCTYSLGRGL